METTHKSIDWGMDMQNVIYLYNGILFAVRRIKSWNIMLNLSVEAEKHHAKWAAGHMRSHIAQSHLYQMSRKDKSGSTKK